MEEKNKNTGLIISLIFFIIVSIGLGGYICYDKFIANNNDNTNVSNTKNKEKENHPFEEVSLTSEQAFKLIESKRENLKYDTWSTLNARVTQKGDNNYYYVTYTEANIDGYESSLGIIFHYENGEWNFELPGFSGTSQEEMDKYNFVGVNSSEYFELNDNLAFTLIEGKRRDLGYDTWKTSKAQVLKKGDNNYYYITYTESNNDGYDSELAIIFHYENGKWNFEIPGSSGFTKDFIEKYNFVDIR